MTATCSGCDARWSGLGRAHCAACHRTFSTVSAFDKHRSVEGEHGACLDPAAAGLVDRDGVIGWPGDERRTAFLANARAVDGPDGDSEGQDTGEAVSTAHRGTEAVTS